jgi:arylsulfatase A-like enzyme
MKFLNHIRLAGFVGLIVGVLHGSVDVIARLILFTFEWFEFYQSLMISTIFFTLFFIILSVIVEIVTKIAKLKRTRKNLSVFYFATALASLMGFYSVMFVNSTLLLDVSFLSSLSIAVNLSVVVGVIVLYLLLLLKGQEFLLNTLDSIGQKKFKKMIKNYIFVVIVFVIVSLFMDLFLLNYMPGSKLNPELEGYPNILVITLDTVRADHLPTYGYPINTAPSFDKIAQESVVFDNALSGAAWSIPGHANLFTGRYPHNHDALTRSWSLKFDEVTMAEILRARGYDTAAFIGGNAWLKAKYGFGQGFTTHKDRQDFFEFVKTFDKTSLRAPVVSFVLPFISTNFETNIHNARRFTSIFDLDKEKPAEEVNEQVFKWLDKNQDSGPFFMFINYYDPHDPYHLGIEFREQFTDEDHDYINEFKKTVDSAKRYDDISQEDIEDIITLYDIELFYLDYHLGKLLEKFDELGLREDTLIIITSDHGEELYDHGYFKHGRTLFQEIIHVPLLIHYPKEFEPRTIKKTVGIVDIFPTVLDVLEMEKPENLDGVSLFPLMKNEGPYKREFMLSEIFGREGIEKARRQIAVSVDDWKLIEVLQWEDTSPGEEVITSGLYNLRTDPNEQKNLYDIFPQKRNTLRQYMINITKQ